MGGTAGSPGPGCQSPVKGTQGGAKETAGWAPVSLPVLGAHGLGHPPAPDQGARGAEHQDRDSTEGHTAIPSPVPVGRVAACPGQRREPRPAAQKQSQRQI